MESLIYLDGKIIPEKDAKISVLDLSVLRGYGVFDFLRTYKKIPFRLWDHLERFEASAKEIELPLPLSMNEVAEIIEKLLKKAPYPEANIKVFLTGGESVDQYMPDNLPTFFAVIYPVQSFPSIIYEQGVSLITDLYQRPFPNCKSIHYLPAIVGIRRAQRTGAHDVLFINHKNEILETGTANFFGIQGKKIITPSKDIIFGITRKVVLELLYKKGIEVEERTVQLDELASFDGAFITSSTKEIVPVVKVDQTILPLHPFTKTVADEFTAYTQSIQTPFKEVTTNLELNG